MTDPIRLAVALAACTALTACGGGGSSSGSTSAVPEGLWTGTATSRGVTFDVGLVVLGDGRYFGLYSVGGTAYGLLNGTGRASGTAFTSTDGRDYPFGAGAYAPFTLSSSFGAAQSISGTAQYSSFAANFSAGYDASYDTAIATVDVAGTYSGSAGSLHGVSNVSMTVGADGSIGGSTSTGCRFTGSVTPHSAGKAVLDLNVAFDAATCGTSAAASGVAGRSGTKGLLFAATLPDRSDAFFGIVSRP